MKLGSGVHPRLESAIAAKAGVQTHVAVGRSGLDFFRCVQREDESALRAGELLVPAHQGRSHRTGRNDERLSLEASDDQREDERDHDRLDRVAVSLAGG